MPTNPTTNFHQFLEQLAQRENLPPPVMQRAMQIMLSGGATPAQIAAFLMAMRMKGETVEELTAAVETLRVKARKFPVPEALRERIIDTCGTGGDKKGTLNISTAVAFVVAGCGVPVVKHGNRAVSSKSGSADVLMELGVRMDVPQEAMLEALETHNVCFLLAPDYHSAMRHVAPVRQDLKMRTMFNLLGPMINPALPSRQLLGVYDEAWIVPMAHVLNALGAKHVWVVHGTDGLDELSLSAPSEVAEVKGGIVIRHHITPEQAGLKRLEDETELMGGTARHNAAAMTELLNGKPSAYRDAVLLNAAAALIIAGEVEDLKAGAERAAEAIDSGAAKAALRGLVDVTSAAVELSSDRK